MTTTKKTTTSKTPAIKASSTGSDQYVIVALPKGDAFVDGSKIHLLLDLSLSDALDILRAIKSKSYTKLKGYFDDGDEIGTVSLIKGVAQEILADFEAVRIDGVDEYPLIDKEKSYHSIVEVN